MRFINSVILRLVGRAFCRNPYVSDRDLTDELPIT